MKISRHEVNVFTALDEQQWKTMREVAALANVAERTARNHLHTFTASYLVERIEAFPSYLYRKLPESKARNSEYSRELNRLVEIYK